MGRIYTRLYVGCKSGNYEVFRSAVTPTVSSHGDKYFAVIGPFRTRAGAEVMANHHGPQIQTVADAERYARRVIQHATTTTTNNTHDEHGATSGNTRTT